MKKTAFYLTFSILTSLFIFNSSYFSLYALDAATTLKNSEEVGQKEVNSVIGALTPPSPELVTPTALKFIGLQLRHLLETTHYRDLPMNEKVSDEAFKKYLELVDYGKQFLLEKDIENLKIHSKDFARLLINGDNPLVLKTREIMNERIDALERYRVEVFKTPFDFSADEKIELDTKKRTFSKKEEDYKDYWRKTFKYSTLTRYFTLLEEQNEKDDPKAKSKSSAKKKNDQKSKKKLSDKELLAQAQDSVSKKYEKLFIRLKKDSLDDYYDNFFNSLSMIYDPHTVYMPPKRKDDFDIDMSGSLEGIGAVLQEDDSYIKVVSIVPGGAAWRQKELEVDDVILAVRQEKGEAVDLIDMKVDDAVRYIRGKKGTAVRLTVRKVDGTIKIIPIVRDVVEIEASFVKSSIIQVKGEETRIGYIYVPKFYRDFEHEGEKNCTDDVRAEIEFLKSKNVDGIIIDVRNNGGGALEDAKQMSGLFIKKGPIVQIKDRAGRVSVMNDNDVDVSYLGPVVVLTNVFSASASEILAGALQDYGRAVIVGGPQTHGKGTVQTIVNLNSGILLGALAPALGALKITIQKFYRVNGASTQYKGIIPDIILPDPFAYAKNREMDLENSLPWDEIKALKYDNWPTNYKIADLKAKSTARVLKNPRFEKMKSTTEYISKKRDETNVSLSFSVMKKQNDIDHKMAEDLKNIEQNKNLLVTDFERGLNLNSQKVIKSDKKKWDEEIDQKKTEWIESLQKDVQLEEAYYILIDMMKANKV